MLIVWGMTARLAVVLALSALAFVLGGCSAAPNGGDDCPAAQQHATTCGATLPIACANECEATCYSAAGCHEVKLRVMYPQPGEADGMTLYSTLDVCLASCDRDH